MGIPGLWEEVSDTGKDEELGHLSSQFYASKGRNLILAIDLNIWLMEGRMSTANMPVKTKVLQALFHKLGFLLQFNIRPVFVLDGPQRPAFKRNKEISTIDDMSAEAKLAVDLIRLFGFVLHNAPGEAEAECVRLQQRGLVDFLVTSDSDSIVFGGDNVICGWEPDKNQRLVNVRIYNRSDIGLSSDGLLLIALLSGGDYDTGVRRFGIKLSTRAARNGYGESLLKSVDDPHSLGEWKESLIQELRTNENNIFERKNSSIVFDDSFPNLKIIDLYKHPIVSNAKERFDERFQVPNILETVKFFERRDYGNKGWDPLPKRFLRPYVKHLFEYRVRIRDQDNIHYGGGDAMKFHIHSVKTDNNQEFARVHFRPCDILDEETVLHIRRLSQIMDDKANKSEQDDKNEGSQSDDNVKSRSHKSSKLEVDEELKEWYLVSILKNTKPWRDYEKAKAESKPKGRIVRNQRKTKEISDDKSQTLIENFMRVGGAGRRNNKPTKVEEESSTKAPATTAVMSPPPVTPTPSKLLKRLILDDDEQGSNEHEDYLRSPTTQRINTDQRFVESSSLESISDLLRPSRGKENDNCFSSPSKRIKKSQQHRNSCQPHEPVEKSLLFEPTRQAVDLCSSPFESQNKDNDEDVVNLISSPSINS